MALFGGKGPDWVITKTLYESLKASNEMYRLKQRLCPVGDEIVYTACKTSEPFITDMPLSEKDKKSASQLAKKLTLAQNEAEELLLAKISGCPLVISSKQVWLESAAKKAGVKTETFK